MNYAELNKTEYQPKKMAIASEIWPSIVLLGLLVTGALNVLKP